MQKNTQKLNFEFSQSDIDRTINNINPHLPTPEANEHKMLIEANEHKMLIEANEEIFSIIIESSNEPIEDLSISNSNGFSLL